MFSGLLRILLNNDFDLSPVDHQADYHHYPLGHTSGDPAFQPNKQRL